MIGKILYGRKKPLTLPNGEKRMAQFVIVDLDEIKASHNEETFQDTEGYPVNELGRNINDRNYKGDPAAQQTVISIAQNIDADKLIELTSSPSGTPIIDKNGFVVSGNNRVMSLKLAAKKYPDSYKRYLDTLALEAGSFGFDENVGIALSRLADNDTKAENPLPVKFVHPVLVRIDEDIPALNTTELAKYNLNAKKGERPVDKAVKLANILRENERCRNVILSVVDGYENFGDLYGPSGRNDRKKLVQAFIDCGLIPEQQMVSYYSDGEFTEAGKDFVESVLSAMILSPDALNVAGQEGVKRLRQIIIGSLPVLITNEYLKEGSLQPYISEAVVLQHKINQVGDFKEYLRTQALFEEKSFSEKAYYLNRLLQEGRNKFKDAIKKYNDATKSNAGESLFGDSAKLGLEEIFERTIVNNLPNSDVIRIKQKFSKPKKMEPVIETTQPVISINDLSGFGGTSAIITTTPGKPMPEELAEDNKSLWANDAWFSENPDKILGEAYQASGRFGSVTKYKGSIDDLNKIEVPDNFIGNMRQVTDPLASVMPIGDPSLDSLKDGVAQRIDDIIEKSEDEVDRKLLKKVKRKKPIDISDETMAVKQVADLQTFEDIYRKYNTQISKDELEVFVWWKSQTGKPLSRRWINLVNPGAYSQDSLFIPTPEFYKVSKEKIDQWVKDGLLFYYGGRYEPEVIYLSGNVYDKKAQLERDKETIIKEYGSDVYDNQVEAFTKAFRKKYDSRLTVTGENEDGLVLIPISKFAENFFIKRIELMADDAKFKIKKIERAEGYGLPDLIKDPETYSDWKKEAFEQLNLKYAFGYWLNKANPELKEPISHMDIIRYYLLGSRIINKVNKESDPKGYEAEKARIEKLKASCQKEGQRLFLFFLNDQLVPEDKARLENEWNAQFNNFLPVDYNKIPVAFTMCKYYKGKEETLKPEKREAVAFSMVEGSACLSYDVGVGKTPSAIFTISAFMDAGYCLRPFICVPNQVYKQFIAEIKEFAPHIPVNEAYNLSEEYAQNFQDSKGRLTKVPAGTITVMTYEGLERIGFSEDTSSQIFSELYEILNQGGEDERQKTQKQKETFMAKLEVLIGKGLRGTMYDIEEFGFDFGCYDEAHKMKKVFTAVKGEVEENEQGKKERGRNPYAINSGVPSAIGLKGFMLSYYIQKNNGWQNILMLTATPFTNSPLEIFSVLSFIAYNKLRETDLNNIKSFFDTYVSTSTELVINAKLKPQFRQVILGFNNLLSLQTLIRRFINYKTGDQANVVRPKKYVLPYLRKLEGETVINLNEDERVETYIPMTPAQTAMMNDIVAYVEGNLSLSELRMSNISGGDTGDDDENADATEGVEVDFDALDDKEKMGVKIIRGITFSRNLALSPYLYEYSGLKNPSYKEYIESSPKLRYVMECVRTVKEWHEKKKEPVSGQVIYMDRGVQYFGLIRDYLVKEVGYQPHEVGIIRSGLPKSGKNSKEYIKNLFNGEIYNENTKLFDGVSDDQRIKVIIGSSTIKEGINLQRYGTVLYNCFIDWNPTDIQQLEGRVWRQGNTFAAVRIVNPLVIDSADIFLFQKLQEKTSRLNSIWATDGRKNVLNTEEFDPEELKYALIRDPGVIAELRSIEDVNKIKSDMLGEQRLINNAEKVKQIVGTINYRLDDMIESVEKYRTFKKTSSKLDDAERIIKVIIDLDKKQTDSQGRKMYQRWDAGELKEKDKWDDKKMVEVDSQYHKPYYFGDFSLAVRELKKMYTTFLNPFKIEISLDNTKSLDSFIEKVEERIKQMEAAQKRLESQEYRDELRKQIEEERKEKKQVYKTLTQSVREFTKLNYLLGERKAPAVRTLTVVCPPMIGDERLTDDESLKQIEECVTKQTESKVLHIDENGNYKPDRAAMHKKIVDDLFTNVKCVRTDKPLAIFTGGAPGSGKSTYLKTIPWLMDSKGRINPNIFHIDADEIRAKLPEYEGWKSSATHKETQDIVNDILNRLGQANCRYDFIYDGTMNRPDKYFSLINKVKKLGYETYIIFMDVPYSVSLQRTVDRYKKKGRYVPRAVIDDFFTMLPAPVNKTKGQYALDQLKDQVDGYTVVDGVTGKIVEDKGINLPEKRYYKKEHVYLVPQAEEKLKPKPDKPKKKKDIVVQLPAAASLPPKEGAGSGQIEKQIAALKLAEKFASGKDKEKIQKQINALSLALKFAA